MIEITYAARSHLHVKNEDLVVSQKLSRKYIFRNYCCTKLKGRGGGMSFLIVHVHFKITCSDTCSLTLQFQVNSDRNRYIKVAGIALKARYS